MGIGALPVTICRQRCRRPYQSCLHAFRGHTVRPTDELRPAAGEYGGNWCRDSDAASVRFADSRANDYGGDFNSRIIIAVDLSTNCTN